MGARELRMKLKSYNIGVRMPWATGPRRKAARGKEEVSQGTLRHSKWELESEERERERESQWTSGKLLVWYGLLHLH